ncbi:MAG: DUF935 domain-containing protein [Deltaproteobacteria bacterium]|nr:DUF935 domain-containing protein [Deltaproteobacteria bacterium]MBW1951467.1 DUF935 domain-containing protein [Deltaproteobacteria bacterium]MBW1986896.1 DUF935 domain-containing protein [Deltaproteobacteria bacterium]MBW2135006.1 DUF935 domain-containing protein [Deltaproteobacteria bacterium]
MALKDFFSWVAHRGRRLDKKKVSPVTEEIAAVNLQDRWSTYPSAGLTPERLVAIFREADYGDIYRQAELFEEMEEKDPHLAGILQTRKLAVLSLDYDILPYSDTPQDRQIAGFVGDIIFGLDDFEDTLLDLLDAIGKGIAVSEIFWDVVDNRAVVSGLRWINQKKLCFSDSLTPRILTDQERWRGIEPPEWKIIYHRYKARSGYDTRAGMLRVVAWMYLFKNYALKDWATFNEVFGMPLRLGKYEPSASQVDRDALVAAIRALGTDAAGVISKNTEIEFVEISARQSGQNIPYLVMAEFCNREMSKAILGQTLTTDTAGSTGTYSAAKTHNLVRQDLLRADAEALSRTLRSQLIQPLVGFNFGWDRPLPWFRFKYAEEEDLKTLSEVYVNLDKIGYPLTQEHVAERFGIPLPEPGQKLIQSQAPPNTD